MDTRQAKPEMPVGVVLAGGSSRRMGRDKALLELDGVSLVERAARRLASICSTVVIADGERGLLDGARSVPDGSGQGPVAGILGAAEAVPATSLLLLACDLPRVPISLLAELATRSTADWVVPRWQRRLEPLCALYRPAALDGLRAQVANSILAPHRLAEHSGLRIDYLDEDRLRQHGDPRIMFTNLNRPGDLDAFRGSRVDPSD